MEYLVGFKKCPVCGQAHAGLTLARCDPQVVNGKTYTRFTHCPVHFTRIYVITPYRQGQLNESADHSQ